MLADGQHVQQLLSDAPTLSRLIDEAFSALDADDSGALTASELKPAVETIKEHVQLPPWGGTALQGEEDSFWNTAMAFIHAPPRSPTHGTTRVPRGHGAAAEGKRDGAC